MLNKGFEVKVDGLLRRWSQHWDVLPQEFPIANGYSARSVDFDDILVKLPYFNNTASFVPFQGVWACLVLQPHIVADDQRR